MRSFKLTLSSLALLLLLCAPAPAQSSPTYSQYGIETGEFCPAGSTDSNGDAVTQSVRDGACAANNNVGQGTSAVNEALTEPPSSDSSASASSVASVASTSAGSALAGDEAEAGTATGSSGTDGSGAYGSETNGTEADRSGGVAAGDREAAGVAPEEGLASITELPETGGPPPAALVSGALLVALGLMARRLAL